MIRLKHKYQSKHIDDVASLQKQLFRCGYLVSLQDVEKAWQDFSIFMLNDWTSPSENADENVKNILSFLVISDEN